MADDTRAKLKELFVSRYAALRRRLEHATGSADDAADILQDTWLRLDTMAEIGPVDNAKAYLRGTANNAAIDHFRRERRHVHEEEVEELFDIPDELADLERVVSARQKVDQLKIVVMQLTPRCRAILLAARVDGQLNREIAERFGISLRMVEKELAAAIKYCAEQMKDVIDPSGPSTGGRRKF
jgi:RNA polymerase sigma factor (sigma-70 family)